MTDSSGKLAPKVIGTPLLTRRTCLGLGAVAAGAGLALALTHRTAQAKGAWTPIRSGERIEINGVTYEAECGSKTEALQRSKSGIIRASIIPGNFWANDSRDDSERTELDGWKSALDSRRPIWSSWSMFYEPGPESTSDWCIVRQVFHLDGWPMPHILKPSGELLWAGATETDNPMADMVRHRRPLERGKWLHFVETYKFDPEHGNGYWKSWLNGEQVLDYKGALGNKKSKFCYVKFGLYRGIRKTWDGVTDIEKDPSILAVTETLAMRYANMRFGYDDLSRLITAPEPIPTWEPWPSGAAKADQ